MPSAPAPPLGFASALNTFTNTTPVNILDSTAVTSTITVTGAGSFIHDVDLTTFITHTFAGDLDITIMSPAGTIVTLTTDNGGGNDNVYNGTLWDDDADPGNQVPYATPLATSNLVTDTAYTNLVVETTLTPEEPLGAFIGEDPNGVWTITISDDAGGDTGTLNSWSLAITTLNATATLLSPQTFTNTTPVTIPTTVSTVSSTITVSGAGPYLGRMTLRTFITHTAAQDLDMTIMSPSGTIVTLTTDNGGANDDVFNGTVWNDDADPGNQVPYASPLAASNLVTDTTYANLVVEATLTPEEPLSAFIGEDPNGVWTITISDDLANEGGTLNSWSLSFQDYAPFGVPGAVLGSAPPVTAIGGTTYTFTVIYSDNVAINVATLGNDDVRVTGPNGYNQLGTLQSVNPGGNGSPRTATYTISAPGGDWDNGDNGTYTIAVEPNSVRDNIGLAVPAGPLGTFTAAVPQIFVVTNTNDAGAGSLRAALLASNATPGVSDFITFSPLFNTPQTINLTSGELPVTDSVTITGPGAGLVNVTTTVGGRLFNVDGPGTLTVDISGVKISGGNPASGRGGGVRNNDEILTLTDVVISGNSAPAGGGGVTLDSTGVINVVRSVIQGNAATGDGGAIYSATTGKVNIQESTLSGNTATDDGGALYFFDGGTLNVTNSTISGNSAGSAAGNDGGAMYLWGAMTATISNSTLSGNSAGTGGAIAVKTSDVALLIRNTTVTKNTSLVDPGGGIRRTVAAATPGFTKLVSTVIAQNNNATAPDVSIAGNALNADFSFLGSGEGLTITGTFNQTGTNSAPLNAQLGPLANNGGATLTHTPLAGSPLLNSGTNPTPLAPTDQRGATFFRTFGAGTDIGAVEVQPPSVVSITTTVPSPTNATPIIFSVVFNQPLTGLSTSNFALTTTGTAAGTINSVGGTGTAWTIGVSNITGTGTIRVDLVDGTGATPAPIAPFTGGQVVVVDRDGPVVQSITRLSANPTAGPTVEFLVTFNEAVTGGDTANFTPTTTHSLAGVTVTNVTGTGNTRTVTVNVGTGNGNLGLALSSGAGMTDPLGNALTALFSGSETYAVGQPVVDTFTGPSSTNAVTVNYTVSFNQAVANLSAGNFSLTTTGTVVGTVGAPTTSDGGFTWTVPVTGISGDGSLQPVLDNGAGTSPAVGDTPVPGPVTQIDRTAPQVTAITRVQPALTNAASVQFTVTFDELVVGVAAGNFTLTAVGVTGASITNVTGGGTTWTVTVNTGSGNGTVTLDLTATAGITDIATNQLANTLTGPTYTIDKTPPAVQSIVLDNPSLTNLQVVTFTVTFTESVVGVSPTNFSLTTTGGVSGAAVTNVSGGGTTWTVTVDTGVGNGTIRLNVQNSAGASDPATNPITGVPFTGGPAYTIEKTSPFVQSIAAVGPAVTNAGAVQFTVTFSEPVVGVTAANFAATTTGTLTNAVVTNVTGSGATYTVTVDTGTGDGTLRLDLANTAGIQDPASNGLLGPFTTGQVVAIDKTPPVIQSIARVGNPTTNQINVDFTLTLSEPVTGLGVGNFALHTTGNVTGAVVLSVVGSGTTYTITVNTGTGDGTIRVDLATPAGVADPATNQLLATNFPTDTVVIDKTPPELVSILRNGPTLTNAEAVTFTVTFTEPVTGLSPSNFTMLVSTITGSGVSSITTTDGRVYTVTVNTGTGDGGLGLALTNTAGVVDPSGQNPPIGGSSQLFTIDKTRPAVTINQANAQADPAAGFPIAFTVVFSEQVTGFTPDDVILSGSAPGGVVTITGSAANYVVNVSGLTASGTVIVSIRAGGGTDAAGNGNLASTSADNVVTYVRPAGGEVDTFTTPALVPLAVSAADGLLRNDTDPEARALTAVLVSQPAAGQGTVELNPDGSFRFTPAPGFVGTATFTYAPSNGLVTGAPAEVRIQVTPRTVFTAAAAGKGGGPQVTVFNRDGSTRFQFFVYTPSFTGGMTVATGDVNGDGVDDIVTGAGAGGGPHVRVFDGRDLTELGNFFAYDPSFTGGVNVAVGDLDGDGKAEVVIGSGLGGGPHVKVVNADGSDRFSFFAYAPSFRGGVNVGVGDVNGDGMGDIVTGAGPGGGPHVQVFRGTDLQVLMSFFAFDKRHRGGAYVAVGDAFADGTPDVIVGSGVSREIWAVRGTNGTRSAGFEFLDTSPAIGTRVATEDTNNDGRGDVLMLGTGPSGPPQLRQVDLTTLAAITDLSVFPEDFQGGLYVG